MLKRNLRKRRKRKRRTTDFKKVYKKEARRELDETVLDSIGKEEEKVSKTELSEKLVGNMIEKVITMDSTIDEKKLKDLIDKQYSIIKYKTVVNEKQIEEIYKKYMDKYLEDIKLIEI